MASWHDQGIHLILSLLHLRFTIRKEIILSSESMKDLFFSLIRCQTYLYDNSNRHVMFRSAEKKGSGRAAHGAGHKSTHRTAR